MYGFNGKEKDNETSWQDYGFRIYSCPLGRFLSIDPLTGEYPMLTPYQFASLSPISGIDRDGLEFEWAARAWNHGSTKLTNGLERLDRAYIKSKGNSYGSRGSSALGTTGAGVEAKVGVLGFGVKVAVESYSTSENSVGFSLSGEASFAPAVKIQEGKGWKDVMKSSLEDPLAVEAGVYGFVESSIRESTDGFENDKKITRDENVTIGVGRTGWVTERSEDLNNGNVKYKSGLKAGADFKDLKSGNKDKIPKEQKSSAKHGNAGRIVVKHNSKEGNVGE